MLKRCGEPAAHTAEREIYWLARTQQTDNFVEKLSRTTHWSISSAALYIYVQSGRAQNGISLGASRASVQYEVKMHFMRAVSCDVFLGRTT